MPIRVGGNAVTQSIAGVVGRLVNIQEQAKVAAQEAAVQHELGKEIAAPIQPAQEGK